jgi:hypothetical protein
VVQQLRDWHAANAGQSTGIGILPFAINSAIFGSRSTTVAVAVRLSNSLVNALFPLKLHISNRPDNMPDYQLGLLLVFARFEGPRS